MADPVSLNAQAGEPSVAAAVAPASLFAAVKMSIGSELPRHAARYLGEDEARVLTALDLLVLATLRRFAQRIATTDGAARLFADLASKRLDTEVSAAFERLLVDDPGEQSERPIPGEAVTARHFGRSTGSVVRAVASATGLGVEAVRRLLVLTTPHVLVALRDYMRAGSLDAESLRQRLANEHRPPARACCAASSRPGECGETAGPSRSAPSSSRSQPPSRWRGAARSVQRARSGGWMVRQRCVTQRPRTVPRRERPRAPA